MAAETAGRGRPHGGAAGIKELARGIRAGVRRWPARARQLDSGKARPAHKHLQPRAGQCASQGGAGGACRV